MSLLKCFAAISLCFFPVPLEQLPAEDPLLGRQNEWQSFCDTFLSQINEKMDFEFGKTWRTLAAPYCIISIHYGFMLSSVTSQLQGWNRHKLSFTPPFIHLWAINPSCPQPSSCEVRPPHHPFTHTMYFIFLPIMSSIWKNIFEVQNTAF